MVSFCTLSSSSEKNIVSSMTSYLSIPAPIVSVSAGVSHVWSTYTKGHCRCTFLINFREVASSSTYLPLRYFASISLLCIVVQQKPLLLCSFIMGQILYMRLGRAAIALFRYNGTGCWDTMHVLRGWYCNCRENDVISVDEASYISCDTPKRLVKSDRF
jgi:hypothetical protein